MENLFDFEGFVDSRVLTSSGDPKDELITTLTSFVQLYCRQRDRLQATSESFTLTAAQLHEIHEEASGSEAFRVMFTVAGGALGAACGGLTGGIMGGLGAVSAATYAKICGDINAAGATVGFAGSVIGGAAGGAFTGALGSAVGTAAKAASGPAHDVVSSVSWFTVGFATGSAIGGIFGGRVGAAGGAVGGAFGALCTTRIVVGLFGRIAPFFCETSDSEDQSKKSKKLKVIQTTEDFREAIKPLLDKLKTIKSISDEMASSDIVHHVSGQTVKALASVTTMEKTISDCRRETNSPQFIFSIQDAARQCEKVTEELGTTRAEVEKVLVSLREH